MFAIEKEEQIDENMVHENFLCNLDDYLLTLYGFGSGLRGVDHEAAKLFTGGNY